MGVPIAFKGENTQGLAYHHSTYLCIVPAQARNPGANKVFFPSKVIHD